MEYGFLLRVDGLITICTWKIAAMFERGRGIQEHRDGGFCIRLIIRHKWVHLGYDLVVKVVVVIGIRVGVVTYYTICRGIGLSN